VGKACGICGEIAQRGLIGHYKEKHLPYYKLYFRLTVLKAIVSVVTGLLIIFFVSSDTRPADLGFSIEILAPALALLVAVVWATAGLYLRKVRKSLKAPTAIGPLK